MKQSKIITLWLILIALILSGWGIYKSGKVENLFTKSVTSTEKEESSSSSVDIIPISKINTAMKGQDVKIKATIVNRTEDKKGNIFLNVSDETGKIDIAIFVDKKIDKQLFSVDKLLCFSGKVDIYNGNLEIVPQSQSDISVVPEIKITKDNIGKEIILKGKVISKYNQATGDIFLTISDSNSNEEVSVPIFSKLSYDSENMPTNSIVSIKGKISEYKGKIEVIPEKSEDINVIEKGDESKIEFINVGDIAENYRGKMITSCGYITNVTENNGNVYFTLIDQNDKNKKIDAVMFHAEGNELQARKTLIYNAANSQSLVWEIAMVDQYNGKLELIIDKIYTK
ncbi:OB-fold nucleic acid binding domain-containing protein [Clostridium sp.]|uniref:OB-fold nucleic acid binding domain-containing protein n=1 Tax=Clostridium sp. TaxID=1506 RepID=UPI00284D166A|nr:OB-fold nucleic acid binding domain-containing protein [Clostridium sp.]MDR3596798.1 OB-fold nucleic acid binding domain-containing protein [Clostridium sp.]